MMYTHKKNKLNSRNVVCYCIDSISFLCLIGTRILRGRGGVTLRYAPQVQLAIASCITHRRRKSPETRNTFNDGKVVEPQRYIEKMENLITLDQNCTPVVHKDISARSLPS